MEKENGPGKARQLDYMRKIKKKIKHMPIAHTHTFFSFYSSFAKKNCVFEIYQMNLCPRSLIIVMRTIRISIMFVVFVGYLSPHHFPFWRKNKRLSCQIRSVRKMITFRTDKSRISIYYWKCICMVCRMHLFIWQLSEMLILIGVLLFSLSVSRIFFHLLAPSILLFGSFQHLDFSPSTPTCP